MNYDKIEKYINEYYMENYICECEERLLYALKMRQEKFPSQKHDKEWDEFSVWVINRKKG